MAKKKKGILSSIARTAKMVKKGKDYETPQAKKTKAHPINKRARALDNIDKMKKDLMAPVETAAQKKKRLERERLARRKAKDNPATRSVKGKIGTALTEKEKQSHQR